MSDQFRAIVVDSVADVAGTGPRQRGTLRTLDQDFLTAGSDEHPAAITLESGVALDVEYSGVNYKDGLAVAGRPGVVRRTPLIAGIDVVGTVRSSPDARWAAGERVVLNGAGLGEGLHGGLSERALVSPHSLVRLPSAISARRAAAIGTAGFTAMLSLMALEKQGIGPRSGEILVTGAAGGVGSVAIMLLARAGYSVTAASGRAESEGDYLRELGASSVIDRAELSEPGRPMQSTRWAGAIDSVGGTILANVIAQTGYGGSVTSCGLAAGVELPSTVLPFILRGVNLLGVNSVDAPLALREAAWMRLAAETRFELLDELSTEIGLAAVPEAAEAILAGTVRGRTVVNVRA
ncbi:MDR family oxidoreductase [Microterricola viridarii]|uniref:Putative quinone oxidoreductase, YhdH/YhfP family n=1 Tax=Microterricola viridarii TaxID=412690 RepID=A0A1H1LPT2_9MICO|nr:MDR family oxidoreductase [Microterricola viridarii]SDR76045.1 putative quinone oxidoreductase, YhdH/YhfP family [Microterricola viridarii]